MLTVFRARTTVSKVTMISPVFLQIQSLRIRRGLEMENSGLAIFIGGIIFTVFLVMGGVFNLRRHDMTAMKSADSLTLAGNHVWSYLTPQQQEELNKIDSLLVQEEWIEENVEISVFNGVSAERILIELANRGFVILGKGVFRRHSSPLDFIDPTAPPVELPEEIFEGPLTKEETEKLAAEEAISVQETVTEEPLPNPEVEEDKDLK
jgi:hypothetical protein